MSIPLTLQQRIDSKLRQAFNPVMLDVINESHLHAGHQNADSGDGSAFDGAGETHFRVRIVSDAFTGLNRVSRHRAINALLDEEFQNGLHALALEPSAPDEPTRR